MARTWTNEELKDEALKYDTKVAFKTTSSSAYAISWKRGILQEICTHMVSNGYRLGGFDLCEVEKKSGIYFLYNNDELVYIGKSHSCMAARIRQHSKEYSGYKKDFNNIEVFIIGNHSDIAIAEVYLIAKLKPVLNSDFNNDDIATITINNIDDIISDGIKINRITASFGVNGVNTIKGK